MYLVASQDPGQVGCSVEHPAGHLAHVGKGNVDRCPGLLQSQTWHSLTVPRQQTDAVIVAQLAPLVVY